MSLANCVVSYVRTPPTASLDCSLKDIKDVHSTPSGLLVAVNDGFNYPRIVNVSRVGGSVQVQVLAGSDSTSVTKGADGLNIDSIYFKTGVSSTTSLVGASSVFFERTSGLVYFCSKTRIGRIEADGTLTVIGGVLPSEEAAVIYGSSANRTTFFALSGLRAGQASDELLVTDTGAQAVYRLNLTSRVVTAVAGE